MAHAAPSLINGAKAEIIPAQLIEDIGAAERVDAAGRLRTLTQEASSAACHLHGDINPDESRALLHENHDDMLVILDALYNGNVDMNIIGAETSRKPLEALDAFSQKWEATDAAILALLESPHDEAALTTIKTNNADLLDAASHLLSEKSGHHSNPAELLQLDAILLNIAGRQSMLTQKIAKEACAIWTGNRSEEAITALTASMTVFDFSMNVLQNGEPNLGIVPAPTPEIAAGLADVMSNWQDVEADLGTIIADPNVPETLKAAVYHDLNVKMHSLDEIVHLYAIFAKHKYD